MADATRCWRGALPDRGGSRSEGRRASTASPSARARQPRRGARARVESPMPMSQEKGGWVASPSIWITWAADELQIAQLRKTLEEGETLGGLMNLQILHAGNKREDQEGVRSETLMGDGMTAMVVAGEREELTLPKQLPMLLMLSVVE
jgi:hypothetical protein